jgi:hypothetical protein
MRSAQRGQDEVALTTARTDHNGTRATECEAHAVPTPRFQWVGRMQAQGLSAAARVLPHLASGISHIQLLLTLGG